MGPRFPLLTRFAVLFSVSIFAVCGGEPCISGPLCGDGEPTLVPTTIQVTVTTLSFDRLGASQSVSATVRDQNGNAMAGQTITWASTDLNVATVNGSGMVSSVGNGTALVSATSGTLSADVTVTVGQIPVAVAITPNPILLDGVGTSITLTVLVIDGGDRTISNPTLVWSSADESTVTVSATGVATAAGAGVTSISVQASYGSSASVTTSADVTVTVPLPPLTVNPTQPPRAEPGLPFNYTFSASGGDGNYTWAVTVGSVPTGLSLDSPTGTVSGTPSVIGTATFMLQVTDGVGTTAQRQFSIDVYATLAITTSTLPNGIETVDYGTETLVATGGDGSYTWALASGSGPLPTGLALAPAGDITGTPTISGAYGFTAEVLSGDGQSAQQVLSIDVSPPAPLLPGESCIGKPALSVVTFEDANLEGAIRTALGLGVGEQPTCASVAGLTALDATSLGIVSLVGMQNLTGLDGLQLGDNAIVDIAPVSGLTGLTSLRLFDNPGIGDISSVAGLTNLVDLHLARVSTSDVASLAGLTALTSLDLDGNSVGDISPLSGLTNLTDLSLGDNGGFPLAPLTGLTGLTRLILAGNNVGDITALGGLTALTELQLFNNLIVDVSSLQGLTSLQILGLQNNPSLSNIDPLLNNTGLGSGDDVDLLDTSISCAAALAMEAKGVTLTHNCTPAVLLSTEFCSDYSVLDIATFSDANLEAAIRTEFGLGGQDLTCGLISGLGPAFAPVSAGIGSLAGIQNLTGLTNLDLFDNSITDVSPLSGMTNLTELILLDNAIGDIAPLSGLNNLNSLLLSTNPINDISPLGGLTTLTYLDLANIPLTDFSALAGLTNLTALGLAGTTIGDISVLAGLTNLTQLWLDTNTITDIAPLTGLTGLTFVILYGNQITDISALQGLTSLETLELQDNPGLANIQPLLNNTGLGTGDDVNISNTAVSCADALALEATGVTLTHNCTPAVLPSTEFCSDYSVLDIASFADANLELVVRDSLGIGPTDPLTCGLVTSMARLLAKAVGITDVTGIQNVTGATWIDVRNNSITDLAWFSGLTSLDRLTLRGNPSPTLTPLSGLTNLTALDVTQTGATDLGPLSTLTGITEIYIQNNGITDISALSGMTGMSDLYAGGNSIADLTPVSGYANPRLLYFGNNSITDVSPLAGLTNLEVLNLAGNSVSDIGPLTGFTNLLYLYASFNTITDITAVTGMTRLTQLTLNDNPGLTNIQPLLDNTGLGFPDEVNLTNTLVSCADVVALEANGVTVTHNCTPFVLAFADFCSAHSYLDIATFEDPNLDAAVRAEIGIGALDDLTCGLVTGLTSLTANGVGITSLVGAQNLTGAVTFRPYSNSITDLSPISGLTALEWLDVHSNPLATLAPLSGLTNLRTLDLFDTETTDVSPLGTLTSLQTLFVHTNSVTNWVTDFSPLASLPLLTSLDARGNKLPLLADVATLSGLTNLTFLLLSNSDISNISPLGVLTNLDYLELSYNSIIDVSALQGLTNLTTLGLVDNALLTNIQPLIDNTGLGTGDDVDLTGTFVSCPSVDALRANGVTVTKPGC